MTHEGELIGPIEFIRFVGILGWHVCLYPIVYDVDLVLRSFYHQKIDAMLPRHSAAHFGYANVPGPVCFRLQNAITARSPSFRLEENV